MTEKIGDYKLQYLNGSNIDEITVPSNSVNTDKSNLKLVGYLYPGYGDEVNQNLIDLLQHYARLLDEPTKTLSGQIWYDRNNRQLKLRTKSGNDDAKWQVICKFVSSESDNFKNYGDLYFDEEHDNIKVWTKNDGWRFINFLTDAEREEVARMVQNNTIGLLDSRYVKVEGPNEIYGQNIFYPSSDQESLSEKTLIHLYNGDLKITNGCSYAKTLYDKNGDDISTTYMKKNDYVYGGAIGVVNKAHKDHMNRVIYDTYATKAEVESIQNLLSTRINNIPVAWKVGDIKASILSYNHDGWLLCDGRDVSRTTYDVLYGVISTRFGVGDGSTTFNVPDYRGKFLRGMGGNGLNNPYSTQSEGLPNIIGSFMAGNYNPTGAFTKTNTLWKTGGKDITHNHMLVNFNARESNSIYGSSAHVTPINQEVYYFIKAK